MSICRLCPNATLYGSTFCPECEAKFERIKREKGPPTPITTARFDIYNWAEFEEFKREQLGAGKSAEEVKLLVYERAKRFQEQHDAIQRANAIEKQRAADIARQAEEI